MSIQPVNGSNSLWQTMKTDFQNLNQSLAAAQRSRSSGNKAQVTISQDALQKAAAAFQSDISSVLSSAGSSSYTTAATTAQSSTTAPPLQTLNQDLANLQSALQSGDQKQIKAAEHTLGTALIAVQKGHHHHHHHHGAQSVADSNSPNSGSTSAYSTGVADTITGTLLSSQA